MNIIRYYFIIRLKTTDENTPHTNTHTIGGLIESNLQQWRRHNKNKKYIYQFYFFFVFRKNIKETKFRNKLTLLLD
jgi:hemerythrin superfamily protein